MGISYANLLFLAGRGLFTLDVVVRIDHLNKIKEAFSEIDNTICFSIKACSNINILKFMAQAGSGFDIVGIQLEGPATRPLERYAIRLGEDGQLEVDKSKTYQEERGQWNDPACYVQTG